MFKKYMIVVPVVFAIFIPAISVEKPLPDKGTKILELSDRKVIPYSCEYSIELLSIKEEKERKYKVEGYKKGREKNLLVVSYPSSVRDIVHLRNRDNIWTYYPTIGETIRIAYQAIFMDTTLNYGDIISIELTRDYNATLIGKEKLNGRDVYKLLLVPKKGTIGYAKILCWIDADTYLPIKRQYYSVSDILMKTAVFDEIKMENGQISLIIQRFYEPLKKTQTIVKYHNINITAKIKDTIFNPDTMKYIKAK